MADDDDLAGIGFDHLVHFFADDDPGLSADAIAELKARAVLLIIGDTNVSSEGLRASLYELRFSRTPWQPETARSAPAMDSNMSEDRIKLPPLPEGSYFSMQAYLGEIGAVVSPKQARVIQEMEDRQRGYLAPSMQALGETCEGIFIRDCAPAVTDDDARRMIELGKELESLDYSPVMGYFYERGLEGVRYNATRNAFVFAFKAGNPLSYFRISKRWSPPNDGVSIPTISHAGMVHPSIGGLAPTGASAAVIGNGTAYEDKCLSCNNKFYHAAFNPPFQWCPNCGAGSGQFLSNQTVASPPAGPLYGSFSPGPPMGNPAAQKVPDVVTMRCPGGCGSEINATRYDDRGAGTRFFTSPCKYSCKVPTQLWNKKVEEAKRK